MWLSKEVAALDKRKAELNLAATKAASFAAGKLHSLISHLRSSGLLSDSFCEQMEFWSQLDSTDAASRLLRRRAVPEKELEPVQLFVSGAEAAESGDSASVATLVDSAPEAVVDSGLTGGPQESLADSAPDHELQDSGPQEVRGSLPDSVPGHKLQDSGPHESIADSAAGSKESLQDSAQDSGSQESGADLAPGRELQDSGSQESIADLAPGYELQDSGPRESIADLAPGHELQDSGPRESIADLAPGHELQDSGLKGSLPDSSQGPLRAETQESFTDSEYKDARAHVSPSVSILRSLGTQELLRMLDEDPRYQVPQQPDVSGYMAGDATQVAHDQARGAGLPPAEIPVSTQVHCMWF